MKPSKLAKLATFLPFNQEMPMPNIGQDTDYPDKVFLRIFLVPPGKCLNSTLN